MARSSRLAARPSPSLYPASWRFSGDVDGANTCIQVVTERGTPPQHRLRIAVEYVEGLTDSVTGNGCEDETLAAAVDRLYAIELAREAARLTGAQGGRKAASRMTAQARSARAKTAAARRWAKPCV